MTAATRYGQNVSGLPVFVPDYGVLEPTDADNLPDSEQVAALFDAGVLREPETTSSEPKKPRRRRKTTAQED